ncbi:hypothetical protein NPIL_126691, partial [Nephila pilipes]
NQLLNYSKGGSRKTRSSCGERSGKRTGVESSWYAGSCQVPVEKRSKVGVSRRNRIGGIWTGWARDLWL